MSEPLVQATGRRKRAVARVRLRDGEGAVTINGRPVEDHFPSETHRSQALGPLAITDTAQIYDVEATIHGGGLTGQAGAMRLGVARALIAVQPELREPLKRSDSLTRDPRKKESKKYGLKKARKAPQYSKR